MLAPKLAKLPTLFAFAIICWSQSNSVVAPFVADIRFDDLEVDSSGKTKMLKSAVGTWMRLSDASEFTRLVHSTPQSNRVRESGTLRDQSSRKRYDLSYDLKTARQTGVISPYSTQKHYDRSSVLREDTLHGIRCLILRSQGPGITGGETWWSPDYDIVMKSEVRAKLGATETIIRKEVTRIELNRMPDRSNFEIPADFKVVEK